MSGSRPDRLSWRHWVLAGLVLAAIVVVFGRLYQIQIVNHEAYLEEAATTRQGAVTVPAPRGVILDATGYPLATSVDTWDIYLDRYLWRDEAKAQTAALALGEVLDVPAGDLLRAGRDETQGDVLVYRDLPYAAGLRLQREGLWGVRTIPSSVRIYPEGDLGSQLVGYVGLDGRGLWGVEADFDPVLRGRDGWVATERDAIGRPIAFSRRLERPAVSGGEVQLTIDRFIQGMAEDALAAALDKYDAKSGSIIVMDPHTGAILAITSRPTVSLSDVDLNDPDLDNLVRNRAVTDLYEPGSVFKTLTTAAALDLGVVTPESTYTDSGAVDVGDYTIRNWNLRAYGEVTVREYLQHSLNTGAVWLSGKVGATSFYDYVTRFGIGEPTHVGLAGEAEGAVRTPNDPDWYPVDLATNAYGQGLAVTPLQMLTAVNVFANEGVLMRPYVVSKVVSRDGVRNYEPVQVRQVIRAETARTVFDLMHDVVEGVPWHGARINGYEVAGKTGTTLVSIPTGYDIDSTIASFAGFAPYEDPQISILVKIDQPSGDLNLGGQVAAPVFAGLAAQVLDYLRVPPSSPLVASP